MDDSLELTSLASTEPTPSIFTGPARRRSSISALPSRTRRSHEGSAEEASAIPCLSLAGSYDRRAEDQAVVPEESEASVAGEPDAITVQHALDQRANVATWAAAAYDDVPLLAILDAPLRSGEPASIGFARKEQALRDAFAQLSILAARVLEKRLANPTNGDRLAEKFGRLTPERKQRLLHFLADARRRAALSGRR